MRQRMAGRYGGSAWVIAIGLVLGSQPVWAATRIHEAANSPRYGTKFAGMLGRGLLNASTCFIDVIVNTVQDTKNGPPFVGTLSGLAKGLGCGSLRLASGAVDLTTFWVPGFNGIPVSASYDNCLAAEGQAKVPMEESTYQAGIAEPLPSEPSSSAVMSSSQPAVQEPAKTWKK